MRLETLELAYQILSKIQVGNSQQGLALVMALQDLENAISEQQAEAKNGNNNTADSGE